VAGLPVKPEGVIMRGFIIAFVLFVVGSIGVSAQSTPISTDEVKVMDVFQVQDTCPSCDPATLVAKQFEGVEAVEYTAPESGTMLGQFDLTAGMSWCAVGTAPWVFVNEQIHIFLNIDEGEWNCGTVPEGWTIRVENPVNAYFSYANADTLKVAIGHPEAFRLI
jgi:hypothetical protein